MTDGTRDVEVAYSYAWWLTGDDDAAAAAVLEAAREGLPGDDVEGLPPLLRRVRAIAAPTPTMCPASEVALLHDAHGLPLDEAAALAQVDPIEARAELAHGRLEALVGHDREVFTHPERLGGLAVGNGPDVAHARQCASCARARELLREARNELYALPVPVMPAALAALHVPPAPAVAAQESGVEPDLVTGPIPWVEGADADILDDDFVPQGETMASTGVVAVAGLVAIGVVVAALLVINRADQDPQLPSTSVASAPASAPASPPASPPASVPASAAATASPGSSAVPSPEASPGATAGEAFAVTGVGLLVDGQVVQDATLTPTDPVRLAVAYSGASEGVPVQAIWTRDGQPYDELNVVLATAGETYTYTAVTPPAGWPTGEHLITVRADGADAGAARFTVAEG